MTSDARKTLAEFLQRELDAGKETGEQRSERKWAKDHKLRPDEVRRARSATTGMSLDNLQKFADALEVEPWQLLFPGFVRGAPQFPTMSADALSVAKEIDKIDDSQRRAQVAAGIINVLSQTGAPAASQPEPIAAPPPPAPDSMRTRPRQR